MADNRFLICTDLLFGNFLIYLLLINLCCFYISACHVSDWQPWTKCSSCQNSGKTLQTRSYPLPAAGYDAGREHMGILR